MQQQLAIVTNYKQQLPWVRMLVLPQIGTPSGQHYRHMRPFMAAASRQVLQANSGAAALSLGQRRQCVGQTYYKEQQLAAKPVCRRRPGAGCRRAPTGP